MRLFRWPRTVLAWTHVLTTLLAAMTLAAAIAHLTSPIFQNRTLLGGHDWDTMEGYRYLVVKTIRRFHQFPFWNPYTCGGHPVWGGVETDTTIVSPFFPVYLFLGLPLAMRIELVGNAVLAASGAWMFAGRFTRSPAVRTFVAAIFAFNSRWTMQAATGHAWHYAYEWTPWTLYFLDRAFVSSVKTTALTSLPGRDIVWAGASLAMMVYMGGIYPLPQTVVLVGIYSGLYAIAERDWRPVLCAVASGVLAFALSAPKLLPLLEEFARFPRLTDSPEWMDFRLLFAILTSRDQDFFSHPVVPPYWGWHEWGMYIGLYPLLVLTLSLVLARGERVAALKWAALFAVVVAFGSFDAKAPWSLMHQVSLFRSQHVPSRWLYPAVLLLGGVAASVIERVMTRSGRFRPWLELVAMAAAAAVAYDVATVGRISLTHAFERLPPRARESLGPFRTEVHMPVEIGYPTGGDWAPNTLPNIIENIGMTSCGSFFPFHDYYRDKNGRTPGLGAHGIGEPGYQGEVYIAEKHGEAAITRWSPNAVTVQVSHARPGDHVVLNQNWDSGWYANGRRTLDWADLPAAVLSSENQTVVFRFVPPTLWLGLAIFATTIAALGWAGWAARDLRVRSTRVRT